MICRKELIALLTCFKLSKIRPFSAKMILLFLPVSSKISCLVTICLAVPIVSISMVMIRSRPLCSILVIRPSSRCLRSSIQKAGGLSGRSGKLFGRYSIGEPQLKSASNAAVSRSRFTSSSSDSYEGIKTL